MVDRLVIPVLRILLWGVVALGAVLTIVAASMGTTPGAAHPELSKVITVLIFALPTTTAAAGLLVVRWWRLRRREARTATPLDPASVWGSPADGPRPGPVGSPWPSPTHTPSAPESFAPHARQARRRERTGGTWDGDGHDEGDRDGSARPWTPSASSASPPDSTCSQH